MMNERTMKRERVAKCLCHDCNNVGIHPVKQAKAGNRNRYLCDYHFYELDSYYKENDREQGTLKDNGITTSHELENSFYDEKAQIELFGQGYINTSDSTVKSEFKSPITHGFNSLAKHVVSIETLVKNGHLSVEDTSEYDVGTHLHLGHRSMINPLTIDFMIEYYHELFVPLCEAMQKDSEKTEKLFGRGFGYWAREINNSSNATEHRNFINMEHNYTIEFRLCKFRNAKQYMNCAWFCRDIVETVLNCFVKYEYVEPKDKRRFKTQNEFLKDKAVKVGNKLAKKFEKYEF